MTLRQIQYVVEAERQGSLSSAAKTLFISQSTLSFAIKELEREIGMTLFERSRNGIKATEDGLVFVSKARQALQAVNELENISARTQSTIGHLRVATIQSGIVPVALSRLAARLEAASGAFRLQSKMCATSEVVDAVADGQSDVGFIYATDRQDKLWREMLAQRGMTCRAVFRAELFVLLPSHDPLAQQHFLELPQLAEHTFVFSGDDGLDSFSNLTDYSMQSFDLSGHLRYFDAQDSMLLNYLLHTIKGFTLAHRSPWIPYYEGLSFVPIKKRLFANLLAILPREQHTSATMDLLFDVFAQLASDTTDDLPTNENSSFK